MTFSPCVRLCIGAALVLTLGGKAAFSRPASAALAPIAHFETRATGLLRSAGFDTTLESRPSGRIVHATRGDCRILVTDYPVHGTMAEPLAAIARPVGPLRFVWRGRAYRDAPKALPLMQFYLRRELRRAGLRPSQLPIAAIAIGRGCGDPGVDWGALATLPG